MLRPKGQLRSITTRFSINYFHHFCLVGCAFLFSASRRKSKQMKQALYEAYPCSESIEFCTKQLLRLILNYSPEAVELVL